MRIDYVVYGDAYRIDGVTKKIRAQVSHWEGAGHDVRVVFVSYAPEDPDAQQALASEVFTFSGRGERVTATIAAARAVRSRRPDVIYMRYDFFSPPVTPMVWPVPVVVEINTDDRKEYVLYGRAIRLYNVAHRALTIPLAAGFVCVTRELMLGLGAHADGTPVAVIANGVDTDDLAPDPRSQVREAGPTRFVMLIGASPPPIWNGVDRVRELALALPEAQFDLIGIGNDLDAVGFPPNVTTHPRLALDAYRPLLDRATAALGPLALYRKGLDEACPLKVREYLLHGLPVLTSHRDTDFLDEKPWYIHRIPNHDAPLAEEAEGIRAWLSSVQTRRVPAAVADRLSVDAKEKNRLAFFEHVIAPSSA